MLTVPQQRQKSFSQVVSASRKEKSGENGEANIPRPRPMDGTFMSLQVGMCCCPVTWYGLVEQYLVD